MPSPQLLALIVSLAWLSPVANGLDAQSGSAAVIQPAAAKLPAPGPDRVITEADCTSGKLGTNIPVPAIGEPVSAVTMNAPVWTAATATAAAQCAVDGAMAPADKAASARPINFRVVLPASWNHRAVQRGGSGINGVIPPLIDTDLGPGYVR